MTFTDLAFINWGHRRVWLVMFILVMMYEAYTLPAGQHDTLSETVRDTLRYTNWRFLLLPLWTWLSWHWFILGPNQSVAPTWKADGIAVAIGLLWASIEVFVFRYATH